GVGAGRAGRGAPRGWGGGAITPQGARARARRDRAPAQPGSSPMTWPRRPAVRRWRAALLLLALLFSAAPGPSPATAQAPPEDAVPGQLLGPFRPGAPPAPPPDAAPA